MKTQGRTMQVVNVPGVSRTIDTGEVEGGLRLTPKSPDVLCIIPVRKRGRLRRALPWLGLIGIIGGAAIAVIVMAPAFGTLLFATLAGLLFAAMLAGEGQR